MKGVLFFTVLASCLTATVSLAAPKYDPGATDTDIKLGQTIAFSGPFSSIGIPTAGAAHALLRRVNEAGGINGRKINLISLDDAGNPPKTVEQTRRLVESEEVLAMVGSWGSGTNVSVHKYLNDRKVPQLLIFSTSSRFLAPKEFPWTMPFVPSAERVGEAYGRYIRQFRPEAKVSIIYQNDEYGREGRKGIRKGLSVDAERMIVAEQAYNPTDPSLESQIVNLKSSGADVLIHVSLSKFAAQGLRKVFELDWHPLQFVDIPASSIEVTLKPVGLDKAVGVLSATWVKDPKDPIWNDDAGVNRYLVTMKAFAPDIDPYDPNALYGYSLGEAIVAVLRQCSDDLTRANIMRQAADLKQVPLSLLLPGITLNTASDDYAPIKQLQLMRFNGVGWDTLGDPH
jgi:branched-chain amino acid transport system substrate-binding protein